MLGRSFLVPVHPHRRATPLSIFLFFRLFRHHHLPACLPASSLSPLFSFLLLAFPPLLCSTFSMRPGIVQLKCRNCPLEFILKFVAPDPFISLSLSLASPSRFAMRLDTTTATFFPRIIEPKSSNISSRSAAIK